MKTITLSKESKKALVEKFNELSKTKLVNPEALFSEVESKIENQLNAGESLSVEILGKFETKNGSPFVEYFSEKDFATE